MEKPPAKRKFPSFLRIPILFALGFATVWLSHHFTDPGYKLRKRLEGVVIAGDHRGAMGINDAAGLLRKQINDQGVPCAIEVSDSVPDASSATYPAGPTNAYTALSGLADACHCTPLLVDDETILLVPSNEVTK